MASLSPGTTTRDFETAYKGGKMKVICEYLLACKLQREGQRCPLLEVLNDKGK